MPSRRRRTTNRRRRSRRPTNDSMGAISSNPNTSPMTWPITRRTRIIMRGIANSVSSGAGVIASYIPFDPSATLPAALGGAAMFNEWSSWLALYGEVRLIRFEVQFCRVYADETKGDVWGPLFYASSPFNTTAPANALGVADNGDAQMWSILSDQTGMNRFISVRRRNLAWALTTTPAPSGGVQAGCDGSIILYQNSLPPASAIFNCLITGEYELRART